MKRERQLDSALDRAHKLGKGYGDGSIQGYNARCQCHRGFGCSPWTKQGLYDEKMARTAAAYFYIADQLIVNDRNVCATEEDARKLRQEFLE